MSRNGVISIMKSGDKFGRLTAVSFSHVENRVSYFLFKCDCGNEIIRKAHSVKHGNTTSCGCFKNEMRRDWRNIDITGQRFGKLTAIAFHHRMPPNNARVWECRCDCGGAGFYTVGNLRCGKIQSCRKCGLARMGVTNGKRFTTHGLSSSVLFRTYLGMMARCYNPRHKSYPDYGGRGITVCERWKDNPAAFVSDIGPRPAGKSIDRINNDAGYSPENCRWATPAEQNANQRPRKKRRV